MTTTPPIRRTVAALALLASLSTSCAGIRSLTLDLRNDDVQGEVAPAIDPEHVPGSRWVVPLGATRPTAGSPAWRLYALFKPD